jgi:hypothetical protein
MNEQKRKLVAACLLFAVITMIIIGYNYRTFLTNRFEVRFDYYTVGLVFNMNVLLEDEEYLYLNGVSNFGEAVALPVFLSYLGKKLTFQKIISSDLEPEIRFEIYKQNPNYPNITSTEECIKNFNDNLLENPLYKSYRGLLEEPLTLDDLLYDPHEVRKLLTALVEVLEGRGVSIKILTDNSYPLE